MQRRSFLFSTGQVFALALAASANRRLVAQQVPQSERNSGDLEERIASVLQAFDAQGNHRTGTAVDKISAEWLSAEVQRLGINPSLEPFSLNRVDPQLAYVRIGNRRIDGIPMFDGGFTGAAGVRGRLGPLGSDVEVGLATISPTDVSHTAVGDIIPLARRSRHSAIILITGAGRPGLFLSNAPAFQNPAGPPMLQVSNVDATWLEQQARDGAQATVVAYVTRTPAQAFNVIASIVGREASLSPLVVMAPRSGWWQCVSEQGSRLVHWLEIMRTLVGAKPLRTCHFVALSGHELGFIGIAPYIEKRPDLIKGAEVWIFLGSDIGQPGQTNLIHAADEALERWLVAALAREGIAVDVKAQHDSKARGETAFIQSAGGRFVTLACGSSVFHSVEDRWPEAVDVTLLARYAKAISEGVLELAQRGRVNQRS